MKRLGFLVLSDAIVCFSSALRNGLIESQTRGNAICEQMVLRHHTGQLTKSSLTYVPELLISFG
ncbi:hypothetical protein I7I53_08509 [Histoplasma capsulatum var. duboisii H88]|uniref:Secreted protein n=2 Tax=Ajellomyces capsulatus TaxID=5037 RepID=A0A8H7YD46_AJECA|nr:hypothetical protein I7I52_11180 [Histoplasma capsulatum]QSS52775.1 hypothetical protein I7I53_08509 [Histoplasma capsulatum var. duboisii H88]QSS70774.1 hypothetical protein I7I50_12513 [Histoplasma capsulatum G186AR]